MCEIAVFDPERIEPTQVHETLARFHEEQGDGIGIVMVKHDGESFTYNTYCSTKPHWATVWSFIGRHFNEAWRVVIHARYKTAGAVNREGCHPIHVTDENVEFDHVVHNGSVKRHQQRRSALEADGHVFNTDVDSEVIAHTVKELPDSVEDFDTSTYDLTGNLNYLLFAERGILVRTSRKYHLTDDFLMTCSRRDFDNAKDIGFEYGTGTQWMLITPGEDEPEIETEEYKYNRTTTSNRNRVQNQYRRGGVRHANRNNHPQSRSGAGPGDTYDEEGKVTVQYDDLAPGTESMSVAQVAPGVLRVEHDGVTTYITRRDDPRTYFHYSTDPVPDNLETLCRIAEREKPDASSADDDTEQQTIDEAVEGANLNHREQRVVNELVEDELRSAIADMTREPTAQELQMIEENVREQVEQDIVRARG
jgi:predicted glutamine amidotransferase